MRTADRFRHMMRAALDVLMPRCCPVCKRTLGASDAFLCPHCLDRLPRTRLEEVKLNAMEQLFAGQVPVERATAYFYYEKTDPYAAILHDIKYHNMPQLGTWLARRAACDLMPSGMLNGIDCVVPVPMHKAKIAKRGYNQSEHIARGMAEVMQVPVIEALCATRQHDTQTRKSAHERWLNSQGLYRLRRNADVRGKHVLLVDDVVTTGATLLVCAQELHRAGARITVFTLAAARLG